MRVEPGGSRVSLRDGKVRARSAPAGSGLRRPLEGQIWTAGRVLPRPEWLQRRDTAVPTLPK